MHQKLLRSAHYIELGSYQYWPVLVPRGIRLYTYEQIPVFLKDNPYITDGYRAYLPSRLCIKSLFILSNETVNIWSHLLGFLLFFTLGIYDLTAVLPAAGASREDFVICSVCLFCFQVCMLCSVGYHLFCCHRSEKTSRRWMALDYAGISIGILGCYVSGVFYAFYCSNVSQERVSLQGLLRVVSLEFLCCRKGGSVEVSKENRSGETGMKTGTRPSDLSRTVAAEGTVLAPGVFDHCAGHDPGSVFCPDPPQLPHTAVAQAALHHLLLRVRLRNHSHHPLGLAQWRHWCIHCPGVCPPCICHVLHRCCSFSLLYFQSSRKILPRPAELPRLEPPGVAHPGSGDAVLVAPVHSVHHAVPTQQALPRVQRGLVSQEEAQEDL